MSDPSTPNTISPERAANQEITLRNEENDLAVPKNSRGLSPEEWERLDGLRKRIETQPYHTMLGLRSDTSASEIQHRVSVLNEWLNSVEQRPGLNGEERAALAICKQQIPLAEWVLTNPEIGPSYVSKVDAREESKGI